MVDIGERDRVDMVDRGERRERDRVDMVDRGEIYRMGWKWDIE